MKPAQFLTYQIIFSSHKNERSFLSKRPRNWLWKITSGMIRKIINTYFFGLEQGWAMGLGSHGIRVPGQKSRDLGLGMGLILLGHLELGQPNPKLWACWDSSPIMGLPWDRLGFLGPVSHRILSPKGGWDKSRHSFKNKILKSVGQKSLRRAVPSHAHPSRPLRLRIWALYIKSWSIISRRKPSTELPDAIKELSAELNALASQTEIVKRKIDELVQQKSLVFKLIKQEISDYGAQLFTMYQVDLNFSNLEKACKSIRKVEQTWRTIKR